jgi:putative transcriptional regulator
MSEFLTHQFLIAMPSLSSGVFSQTVTYVCEHNDKGALGIVINRPMKMLLAEVFEQYKLPTDDATWADRQVLRGGPVQQEQGFVIHRGSQSWDATTHVSDRVHLTTSRDILDAMARGGGPEDAFVALGYAGWEAGQLETEISNNAWLTVAADERVLFEIPYDQRWLAAGRLLGVNLTMMSQHAGHA